MNQEELILRLSLALFCGGVIGFERQWNHKTAGLKTNSLVALGGAVFTLIGQMGFSNPAQITAGVVTGIGFIGAGVIIRHGGGVQGVSSAATLWVTAGLGIALGIGKYRLTLELLLLVMVSQFLLHRLALWIDRRADQISESLVWRLSLRFAPAANENVRDLWKEFTARPGVVVTLYSEQADELGEKKAQMDLKLSDGSAQALNILAQRLSAAAGVAAVEWRLVETGSSDIHPLL
ncbi:MAG: MgtC/SapB family protein [Chloracidobacterium sp.]|nr:MgtC/SapB family protein [Chloracidobacterium sp.]